MEDTVRSAVAIVGVGAILPDAPSVARFWDNIKTGHDSIREIPPGRWDPALYYDSDPSAPDKTYSKIGGWVREQVWDPVKWHLPIPPRVAEAMDETQKWAIAATREALEDYGYPKRALDPERTAVILGNAMAGEQQFLTVLRAYFPEYAQELEATAGFASLPEALRRDITREFHQRIERHFPKITEDTMPGELANCIAGRIANLYNLRGPNYVVDAACASSMAALSSAVDALAENDFDLAISGGVDHNMGASTFIKFSKIGALSATGSRPYAEGADGFVMGEGAVIFMLKRLIDAERDGDKIYAVLRGIGGSSDGKGKGITAPNPIGQKLALERAWQNAGLSPASATLIEGHGTSTRVGDLVETESLAEVLSTFHLAAHSIALGSVKSNIGHLKGAAGAAGLLKTALALHEKVLPPSLHCDRPNPDIDFQHSPLFVNTELQGWTVPPDSTRCAGVSAFGFGGTNFHLVLEEHIPQRLTGNGKRSVAVSVMPPRTAEAAIMANNGSSSSSVPSRKAPLRGAMAIGASSDAELVERLRAINKDAVAGRAPTLPSEPDLRAPERLAIDYADAAELADKSARALKAFESGNGGAWRALRAKGVFRGRGPAPKVAFLYTGQGSQYVNMLQPLRDLDRVVADTFAEADRVLTPLLGKPLTEYIFVDHNDGAVAKAEQDLRQTAITQPAVLATDIAITRLLAEYGIAPDMTMGHSLGEYGALVAAGALPFGDALEAVSARGREMTRVSVQDNGRMAAIFAPLEEIERVLKAVEGYVVIANINSGTQAVIGGATKAVEQAMDTFQKAGFHVIGLPVSHAFHTSIVAPASGPLRSVLERLHLQSPRIPVIANVTGDFYPMGPNVVPQMLDILSGQVASPVQFVKGLRSLYGAGVRVFVESGPKRALQGFVDDVLGDKDDVVSLFTNHPKREIEAFNQALCGLYAAGLGHGKAERRAEIAATASATSPTGPAAQPADGHYAELGRIVADALERGGWQKGNGQRPPAAAPVVISGAALGLPGTDKIFDDENVARILRGDQFIDVIPTRFRRAMLDKHITRLVKSEAGGATFESIDDIADVIKLAGRGGSLDIEEEFGVSAERVAALDRVTQLALAAGIDALRDAGIPLVMRYKTTSKGTQLPDRWMLPDELRDDTGVVFASAFPGCDSLAQDLSRYHADQARREQLSTLEALRARSVEGNGHSTITQEIERRIDELRVEIGREPFVFNRRFLFRVLSMGHSQFAEFIGARGPNTQVNAACASTTQAITIAEDWIKTGRCRRVVVISADDITSDNLIDWFAAGFLASGAAATDEVVEEAAIPFDRRRHGMIIGMGAAAVVVETADAARERGLRPICEVLASASANSAFHGTRLNVEHISDVMESLIASAEKDYGIRRSEIARQMVFVSHETYTPARGGSASAEIHALRHVFGDAADRIVIANTKGFTGHPMGTGIEDVVAVKALETSCVPPVPNFKEVDPELGSLNLSKGGIYPVEYALRLAAGFGSQIGMTLLRWVPSADHARPDPRSLGYVSRVADQGAWKNWLSRVAGAPDPQLEVVQRTLRVQDRRAVAKPATMVERVPAAQTPAAPVTAPVQAEERVPVRAAKPVESPTAVASAPVTIAPAMPPGAVPAPGGGDAVKDRILAIVAEKTGYPTDMLDLDLDLEADLGVDTVKQAEVFASVREAYGIQRDEKLRLRDFPTLAHVIRFVYDKRPDLKTEAAPTAAVIPGPAKPQAIPASPEEPVAAAPAGGSADAVKERVLALVVEKTGYPEDMLDLDLDLEADLGIDTVKQAEMFAAIREIYNIPRDESRKLRDYPTLSHVIRFVFEKRPDLAGAPAPVAAPSSMPQPARIVIEPVVTVALAASSPTRPATADDIKDKVLEIVAEKTGYPKDMLDLDLDLEADLGIDTVKQAEMFAAVRAAYDIPRDEHLKLRDFPTLAHVIRFAQDRRKQPAAIVPSGGLRGVLTPDEEKAPPVIPMGAPKLASLDAANNIPRRVPVPVLRPPLSICKPTEVMLGQGTRVVLMPDRAGVADALAERLAKLGVEVLKLEDATDAQALAGQIGAWLAAGPVQGVYWLPALDNEGSLQSMDPATWRDAIQVRLKALYATMRLLYPHIAEPNSFLISATRLGGQHGYDDAGAVAPLGGAVTGFTKTYKRERIDALVKAVDFEAGRTPSEIAELLIEETLRDRGAVEIGYKDGRRWTVALAEQPATDGRPGLTLDQDSVFLVTGAAGSIVSAITADLAAVSGGTFYLLDLVPEPDPSNPDIKRFVNDKEGLKRDLFARIQTRGERATPALVERELAALERAHAALSAIQAVRSAGGTAHYFSVNLTDAAAVASVVDEVRRRSGRIDVLLHAAGMERSRLLPDKEPREFDLVFDVKADGWFNLLHAIADMPVKATVAFSSIAGRFGNAGQTDYSSANDLLCKITSSFRSTLPNARGIVIDWTAWSGIGMASRGSIPKMMEIAGIDMLPPEAGIPLIRRELTAGSTRGEVVIGQRLGIMLNEWDPTGGLDLAAADGNLPDLRPMVGTLSGMNVHTGLTIETTLDPKEQPFLHDHQIDKTPVLPGVMGMEAFAEAAVCLIPEWHVTSLEDVNFLAPFKFYRAEKRTLTLRSRFRAEGDALVADCTLIGSRTLPGQPDPQLTTHFTGRVRLSKDSARPVPKDPLGTPVGALIDAADIYKAYFHGPAYQVMERAWWDGERVIGLMSNTLPAGHHPPEQSLVLSPRLVELCFQTAGLWEMGIQGRLGLPLHIDRVSFFGSPEKAEGRLYAFVTPDPAQESFEAEVVDASGNVYIRLHGYKTIALPGAVDPARIEHLEALMSVETEAV